MFLFCLCVNFFQQPVQVFLFIACASNFFPPVQIFHFFICVSICLPPVQTNHIKLKSSTFCVKIFLFFIWVKLFATCQFFSFCLHQILCHLSKFSFFSSPGHWPGLDCNRQFCLSACAMIKGYNFCFLYNLITCTRSALSAIAIAHRQSTWRARTSSEDLRSLSWTQSRRAANKALKQAVWWTDIIQANTASVNSKFTTENKI